MTKDNLISIVVPPEVVTAVQEASNVIVTQLKPYLIALSKEERKTLPKMGDKTIPLVEKVVEFTGSAPEFVPSYMDVQELKNDFGAVSTLNLLYRPLLEVVSNMSDTILSAGSDSYKMALKYYDSVRMAAKNNVPNAKVIYDGLRKRFESQGKKTEPPTPDVQ